jgi:phage terminase large subunit-like protein
VTALREKQIPVAEFGQGYVSMSAPTKEIERLVVSRKLVPPNDPVLTWCASNVVVQMDPAGNVKPNRERSGEKIDGAAAMAMAIGRILARQPEPEFDIRIF